MNKPYVTLLYQPSTGAEDPAGGLEAEPVLQRPLSLTVLPSEILPGGDHPRRPYRHHGPTGGLQGRQRVTGGSLNRTGVPLNPIAMAHKRATTRGSATYRGMKTEIIRQDFLFSCNY